MTERGQDEYMLSEVRKHLDAEANDLDELTRARLSAARHRALAELDRRPRWPMWLAGTAAVAMVLALSLAVLRPAAPPWTGDAADFELLVSGGALELYEDLEFYDWLAQRDDDDAS